MHLIYEFHYAGEDEREKVLALQLALNATEITCKYVTNNHGMEIQVDNILILLLLFNNVLTHMTRAEIYSNRGPFASFLPVGEYRIHIYSPRLLAFNSDQSHSSFSIICLNSIHVFQFNLMLPALTTFCPPNVPYPVQRLRLQKVRLEFFSYS